MCLVYMPKGHDLESYLCSLEQVAAYSEPSCLDGKPSGTSNSTDTANECCSNESEMDCSMMRQSSETCESSLTAGGRQGTEDTSMLSQEVSRVNRFPLQASSWVRTTPETCGPQLSQPSMLFDRDSASLRTSQLSLIVDISEPSSETWPRSGIVFDGKFYPQPKWERRINEIGYGLWPTARAQDAKHGSATEWELGSGRNGLHIAVARSNWPTPAAHDAVDRTQFTPVITGNGTVRHRNKAGGQSRASLSQIAKMWPTPNATDNMGGPGDSGRQGGLNLRTAVKSMPTPTASDADKWNNRTVEQCKEGGHIVRIGNVVAPGNGGQLSPGWVEWLMGWPVGWTSLDPLPQNAIGDWATETVNRQWWQHEHDLPRVAKGVANRAHRLRAIGNGQVPLCAAIAWLILTSDLEV